MAEASVAGEKPLYYKNYENGYLIVYPDVLVARYTDENGVERLIIFRYHWLMTDHDGFTADGPEDTLYIYADEKRIKHTERDPHDFC